MSINEFPSFRLSVSDLLVAPLRPISIVISGTGNQSFNFDSLPYDFIISDIFITGTGTLKLSKSSTDYLIANIDTLANISPRMFIPIKKGEGFTLSFTATGSVTITILGFSHT